MNRIERYLGKTVVAHSLLVLLVLLTIIIMTEFMMQLGSLRGDYTFGKGVAYSLLKVPVFGYQLLPVAILIGSLLGLGALANKSELTVLRATGWSIKRIFWAVMKSVLIFWLVMASLGEWLGSPSEALAVKIKAESLQSNISLGDRSGFWVKDGERIIHIQRAISQTHLSNLVIYEMQNYQLKKLTQAKSATYLDGNWQLKNAYNQTIDFVLTEEFGQEIELINWQTSKQKQQLESFPLDPEMIDRLQIESKYLRIDELYQYVKFLRANQLDTGIYELDLWRKIAEPLVILGMIALVFPLIFGSQRSVSMGQRMFVGVMIGMGFHLINQLFGNLSLVYHLPPVFGAFLPSLVLLAIAWWLFSRLR